MAGRLDVAGKHAKRTTGLPTNSGASTTMLLVRQPTVLGQTNCYFFVRGSHPTTPGPSAYERAMYLFMTGGGVSFRCGEFHTGTGGETDSGDSLTENVWYWVIHRRINATTSQFTYAPMGGSRVAWDTANAVDVSARAATVAELIGELDAGSPTNFDFEHLKIWTTNLSDAQIDAEIAYGNPQLATNLHTYTPFKTSLISTTGSNWSEIGGTISFPTLSGIAESSNNVLTAAQASYAFTPQNVGTKPAFGQPSDFASYTFTPQNVATSAVTNRILTATQAAYAFTPQNVGSAGGYVVAVDQASYSLTLQNVGTTRTRTVDVTWLPVVGNEGYVVEWGLTSGGPYSSGSATVGTDVLTYGISGLAERTTYFWRVADLIAGVPQTWSSQGTFTTGIDPMVAEPASYAFTPRNVGTTVARGQTSDLASYTFTPQNVGVAAGFSQTSDAASFTFTPQNVATSAVANTTMVADAASYVFTPQDVSTRTANPIMVAELVTYMFTPQDIVSNAGYGVGIGQASFDFTPQNVGTTATAMPVIVVETCLYTLAILPVISYKLEFVGGPTPFRFIRCPHPRLWGFR